jgi:hypothetical protein
MLKTYTLDKIYLHIHTIKKNAVLALMFLKYIVQLISIYALTYLLYKIKYSVKKFDKIIVLTRLFK